MNQSPVLIIGGNGKTGSRVAARLQTAGIPVRGVSRSTEPRFDWEHPETWQPVLQNVKSAYLTYHPDLAVPEAEHHIREFCAMALRAGVQHVVLLSGRGEEGARRAEAALQQSGLHWNIVKASWFAQNFSESFMLDGILGGELTLPMCASLEPFVDLDDVADVVVAALLEPGLRDRLFEVTGPKLMTFADCVNAITAATGQPISLKEVPLNDYIDELRRQGVPAVMCQLLRELFSQLFDGRNATIANGVREALGRDATDFVAYARKASATGVWKPHSQRATN